MIEVAFALSFEHEMGEQSAKFHFTRERVAAVVSGCAVRLLQSMASVSLSVEYLHTLGGGMIDAEVNARHLRPTSARPWPDLRSEIARRLGQNSARPWPGLRSEIARH